MALWSAALALMLLLPWSARGAQSSAATAAEALIARVLPSQAKDFRCEVIATADGSDVFEYEAVGGRVVLRGNNAVSLASALNHYLKYVAHCDISYGAGVQLALPNPLPLPPGKTRIISSNRIRYAYNYCTHGYTMAWWDWNEWEREIDLIALNGINTALVIEGQETVWLHTLERFGYTNEEVRKWLVMPSHQPWMYMSNMEGYGGPVPQALIDGRLRLGLKIVSRMRELGIEPVLQGYYGIVPSTMKSKFPTAVIHSQGQWCGHHRPDMLDPLDPLFPKLADVFLAEQAKLFGKIKFLAADPFHEGGSTVGIDIPKCGNAIFEAMQRTNPEATWVLMSWGGNPHQSMLDGLDKSKLLVLDLDCEKVENWRARGAFHNTPWLWCVIENFGGNDGLDGVLARYSEGYARAMCDPSHGRLSGIGAVPEGSRVSPAIWELFFENAWRSEPVKIGEWVPEYLRRRYGVDSESARSAWDVLLRANYGHFGHEQEPFNTVMHARPSLSPNPKAREWASLESDYRPSVLPKAWEALIDAAPECGKSDGFRYDVVDFTRQVLADAGTACHRQIVTAFEQKDRVRVAELTKIMLGLFDDMDAILGTRREFLLGPWLHDARAWGTTPAESDLCEYNARALITIWSEPSAGSLRDYANRSWSGLVKDFYKHRWEMWLGAMNRSLADGTPFDANATREAIRQWEFRWVHETTPNFPTEPAGDTVAVARELVQKYQEILSVLYPKPTYEPSPEAVLGAWEYQAQGSLYLREFRDDGTIQAYTVAGAPLDWFKGFVWRIEDGEVMATRPDGKTVKLTMPDKDTLVFASEGFGPAKRVPVPASR